MLDFRSSASPFSLPPPSRFIISIFSSLKLPCISVYSAHLIGWQNANLGWIYCTGEVITQLSGFELCLSHCLVIITVFLYFPSIFCLSQWLYHSFFPQNLTLFSPLLIFASLYTHMHTYTIQNLPQFPAKISTNSYIWILSSLLIIVLREGIPSTSDQFLHMLSRFCFLKPFSK